MSGAPEALEVDGRQVLVRDATAADLPEIIALLADDPLGTARESAGGESFSAYLRAFEAIDADPAHRLVVCTSGSTVVGTLQFSLIPGIARQGAWRAQLEAVRIHEDFRGKSLGSEFIRWAIEQARSSGCSLIQLTTDKRRISTHRFYERLGFSASHEGMKLEL